MPPLGLLLVACESYAGGGSIPSAGAQFPFPGDFPVLFVWGSPFPLVGMKYPFSNVSPFPLVGMKYPSSNGRNNSSSTPSAGSELGKDSGGSPNVGNDCAGSPNVGNDSGGSPNEGNGSDKACRKGLAGSPNVGNDSDKIKIDFAPPVLACNA